MKHVFLIDPLSKLNIKKDSSLYMASTLKKMGHSVYLTFADQIYYRSKITDLTVFDFDYEFLDDYYLKKIEVKQKTTLVFNEIILQMRLDPPFDMHYLQILWMLDLFESQGMQVKNSPRGILRFSEKMTIERFHAPSIPSYFGSNAQSFKESVLDWKEQGYEDIILKPVNLFSGIGVEKLSIDTVNIESYFSQKVSTLQGALVAQPFLKAVYQGEKRALLYRGKHIGSILKKAVSGSFLANIAQGASFEKTDIAENLMIPLKEISLAMMHEGVDFIAVDILDDKISEINITCPGLVNEVSKAQERNLTPDLFSAII